MNKSYGPLKIIRSPVNGRGHKLFTQQETAPMKLTPQQLAQYDRDGFLIIPDMVSPDMVRQLRAELQEVAAMDDECVYREKDGVTARTIYNLHNLEHPTGREGFAELTSSKDMLTPVSQLLGDDALYVVHSKCNLKQGLVGGIWGWHQDFGIWRYDGIPSPEIATALVMLDEATELGGCLYFVPGSHKAETLLAERNAINTGTSLRTLTAPQMEDIVAKYGEPVAVKGKPGTVAIFHSNLVHGSGHNMSTHARWQLYLVYNTVANRPRPVENPRPEYQSSRIARPIGTPVESPVSA